MGVARDVDALDGLREASLDNRAQLYKDIASAPFFGFNRSGAVCVRPTHLERAVSWTSTPRVANAATSDRAAEVNPTINTVSYNAKHGWVAAGGVGPSVEIYDANDLHWLRSLRGHGGTIWWVNRGAGVSLPGHLTAFSCGPRIRRCLARETSPK